MTARAALLVFDDYIPAGTSGSVFVYTPSTLNDVLGSHDVIACEVVVDDVDSVGTPDLLVDLQHAADDRNFVFSNGKTSPDAPDLQVACYSFSTLVDVATFNEAYPLLGYVRFAFQFNYPGASARVRLFVVQRDLA
jgi:hypothetical protein